ncbi:type IV toxin-antitoxin system AbiEi family antitoxin [Microbacterium sp. NPDC091313]
MPSPFVYFAGARLSSAELTAACLDGDLVALGSGFVPADVAESPWLRAASLGELLGESLAAVRLTAAWVHGAIDRLPHRPCVQRAVPHRLHRLSDPRVCYHDVRLDGADLLHMGGVRVSSPARTIADLARFDDAGHPEALRAWCERDPDAAAAAVAWLAANPRLPHGGAATRLIKGLSAEVRSACGEDQDEVTR